MIAEASWTFLLPVSYPSETNKIVSIFLSARPIRNQFRIANLSKNQPLSTLNTHDITLSDRYLPTSFPQTSKKNNNNFSSSSSRCLLSSKPARQISKHHIPTSKPSTNRTYSKSLVLSICLSTPLWRSPVLKQVPL